VDEEDRVKSGLECDLKLLWYRSIMSSVDELYDSMTSVGLRRLCNKEGMVTPWSIEELGAR